MVVQLPFIVGYFFCLYTRCSSSLDVLVQQVRHVGDNVENQKAADRDPGAEAEMILRTTYEMPELPFL